MTDRELLQQALEWFTECYRVSGATYARWGMQAMRERLSRCDRCGKPLGTDGHIHTCSPQMRRAGERSVHCL